MRGSNDNQSGLMTFFILADRIPREHPLRALDALLRESERALAPTFAQMYAKTGRPSIPPERILRALLLQALFSIRSERLLCEMINYNLLFRWFLGMSADEPVFDHSVFAKNRDRLIDHDVARELLAITVEQARAGGLLSDEHFSVDGTLIAAWASHKSFKRKDGSDDDGPDFHGQSRSNDTHASTTDPEARLARKGKGHEAKLAFLGTALMDNRHDLIADARVSIQSGTGEREDCAQMLRLAREERGNRRITTGADKGFDTRGFVVACRDGGVTPHVAQRKIGSAIDGRTTRHAGHGKSQNARRGIEKIFGWVKVVAGMAKTKLRGWVRNDWQFCFTGAVYNLMRMRNLAQAGAWSPP